MAKFAGYYDVDDFNDYKRKQAKCLPPRTNVLAAACHIQKLFDAKNFMYGFMGGLSMLCLGYKREMPDLHIAYDDKDFERLKSKLGNDRRYDWLCYGILLLLTTQGSTTNRHELTFAIQGPYVDRTQI